MNQREIRGWLLKQPRPVQLRATCGAEQKQIPVTPGQSWASVAASLAALGADLIEALDGAGGLIRALRPDDGDSDEPTTADLANDAETVRFQIFASHVAEAYRFANETAFARLADLFDSVARKAEAQERVIDQFREQAAAAGVSEGDMLGMMVSQFMQGQGLGKAAAKTNGASATNGAGGNGKKEH